MEEKKDKSPHTGMFKKGNKAAVGHKKPHVNDVKRIRSILFESISEGEWTKVKETLLNKALEGDVKAMTLLFTYVLGKPVQSLDVNVTQANISPEEAKDRIHKFFGIDETKEEDK